MEDIRSGQFNRMYGQLKKESNWYLTEYAHLERVCNSQGLVIGSKLTAPGEARTRNHGIARILPYKYRALTNCATGAGYVWLKGSWNGKESKTTPLAPPKLLP